MENNKLPQIGTKEFNDMASAYFGGAPKQNKMTAVEWLIEQLTPSISLQQKHIDDLKEQAKKMELQQLDDFYHAGYADARKDILQS